MTSQPLQSDGKLDPEKAPWRKPMDPERLKKIQAVFEKARIGIVRELEQQRRLKQNGL